MSNPITSQDRQRILDAYKIQKALLDKLEPHFANCLLSVSYNDDMFWFEVTISRDDHHTQETVPVEMVKDILDDSRFIYVFAASLASRLGRQMFTAMP